MKTKIKSITVINQQGTRYYGVGHTYNDLELAKISNLSEGFDNGWNNLYAGFTSDGQLIFEVVNCSTDVQYEPAPVDNPCPKCGDEWDQETKDSCPQCGNIVPF